MATAVWLALAGGAYAQDGAEEATAAEGEQPVTLGIVQVTAQKRVENVQEVPISLQVLGALKLDQMNVKDFDDYAKLIPSLSYGTSGGGVFSGPGFAQVYMRGVVSGGDGNHSASQPSVGMYLDEQPITTIQGALDIHMYDIERVEALAGPQGTLFGASSQAGTVRIITKKPDSLGFEANARAQVSAIDGGGIGHVLEGMVNQPLGESAAIRLVGWRKHDAGYVDNVLGSRTFPSWDADSGGNGTITNADRAEDDYNTADTVGARASLKFDINENWTVTPTVMGQRQKAYGSTGYDPSVGELEITHFYPEYSRDRWLQAALTVEGKVGNFDLTYAYSNLKRDVDSESDYNDYGYWYDTLYGYGVYFCGDFDPDAFACAPGSVVNPSQRITAVDGYRKESHELRIASPAEHRIRFVAGLFWQTQRHDILQRYRIDGLSDVQSVPGWEDTIWLTNQDREDHDEAVFGQVTFDATDKLSLTGGLRFFRSDNSLAGFRGFGDWGWSGTGVATCASSEPYQGAPCTSFDKSTKESDSIGRFNATYQISEGKMVYFTWSEGYRPGGVNRVGNFDYTSDFLTNWELGWKTSWLDNRLLFNAAMFRIDWNNFQFSFLGPNSLTIIANAASAQVDGLELELDWAASYNLQLSAGLAFYDARLADNYCGWLIDIGNPETNCPAGTINPYSGDPVDGPVAAKGDRLPITPRFKGSLNARYSFDWRDGEAFWQATLSHQGQRTVDLRAAEGALLGSLDSYSLLDLSAGYRRGDWSVDAFLHNVFDERAQLTRFAACNTGVCGNQPYTVVAQPRTLGIRFSRSFF
ncbi:MAG TPA: TonB-dependent receptor [Arenimonas sp.]|nr:TonB-dependent receptor [Arenimonas sp.]